jgi:hypothetical protein
MTGRITLRAVADAAGVSRATASLALSGSPKVAKATRRAVEAAAACLGYVRDPALSSLASGRFRHAGRPPVVAIWVDSRSWIEPFHRQARRMGMEVRELTCDPDGLPAALADLHATALVVNQRGVAPAALARLQVHTILWEDEGATQQEYDLIETHEWWTATTEAVTRLGEAGYRRPALIAVTAIPRHWHDQVRATVAASLGLPVLEWNSDPATLQDFLARTRPDALLGGIASLGKLLPDLGVHLPFVALQIPECTWFSGLAGWVIDQDCRGQATLELVEQRLRYGPRPPRRIIIPPRWRDGPSLPRNTAPAG